MAGISFISLNPKYMDVLPYISEDEYDVVYKYMQNGYQSGKFSGYTCKNPLNYQDICIVVSYNFDEAIHVGIPEISDIDKEFSEDFGLEYTLITSSNHLIHSDFLDGLTPKEARDKIILEYASEGCGEIVSHFKNTKIVISSVDETGAPIPFEVIKDGFDFAVLDSEYYPLIYNKFSKVNYGRTPNRNVELINMTFNHLYQTSILKLFLANPNNFYNNEDFLNYEDEFIYKSELAYEILFPIIFDIVDDKVIRKVDYKIIEESYPDSQVINDINNLNIHFISDTLKDCTRDAIRFYVLQHPNDTNFEEILLKIRNIDSFLNDLLDKYQEGFIDVNMELDNTMFELVNELNGYISSMRLDLYVAKIEYIFNNKIRNKKWTEDEALIFLKLISIVCPFISEYIFRNIFNQRDYIIFEEWPRY